MLDRYVAQVRLLLGALPDIAREAVFALKGGTAINLFYRDMPRLSVDIDLTYLPVADRRTSLEEIDGALDRIVKYRDATFEGSIVTLSRRFISMSCLSTTGLVSTGTPPTVYVRALRASLCKTTETVELLKFNLW